MTKKEHRDKYPTKIVRLIGEAQRRHIETIIANAPIDPDNPIEIVVREETKQRKLDQNALMWVNQLADIAEQAYVEGRTYSAEVWHEHFKEQWLPEDDDPELIRLVKDVANYHKWSIGPSGKRILTGSTTQLSIRGFALYLQQVELHGESMGVMFRPSKNSLRNL